MATQVFCILVTRGTRKLLASDTDSCVLAVFTVRSITLQSVYRWSYATRGNTLSCDRVSLILKFSR